MINIPGLMLILSISCIIGLCKTSADQSPVAFTFKEYQYKDSPKNEMTFREFETACEQGGACSHLTGQGRTRCVRECVSPSCYRELYQADPLLMNTTLRKDSFLKYVANRIFRNQYKNK